MVIALLCKEVMDELGITKPLTVVFYDEEFVFPETLDSVAELFALPWVDGKRLCLRTACNLSMPDGTSRVYETWDSTRELYRPKPADGLFDDSEVYVMADSERAVQKLVVTDKGKRVVQILGVRAQESLTRRATILQGAKRGAFCFLLKSAVLNFALAEPIYDWKTEDVFFYLKSQTTLTLNKLYYQAMLTKRPLRVSMPLHGAQRMNLVRLKEQNPIFYEMLIRIVPDLDNAIRYMKEAAQYGDYDELIKVYGEGIKGCRSFINDKVEKDQQPYALQALKQFVKDYILSDRYMKQGHTYESAVRHAFKEIVKGHFAKTIMLPTFVPPKPKKIAV